MNFLILSSLCLFVLIPITHEINCISCTGWSNSGCNDPYNEATSGDLPVPGNTYCLKVVYPTYVERMAGGRACTSGSGVGSSVRYCCSDKDYWSIALLPYADVCPNVTRAIASYFDKQMPLVRNDQLIFDYALTKTKRSTPINSSGYLSLNNRRFSLVDVSEHEIL
ncbi:unnamed protein product [Rotaria sordida]|uniref:Uncharacterized protein n=1 Tax=Rotaria sordida TaxID=392033 RepID=A0A818NGL9_9BILA|nr:unnamed protein product [Rotaria sordida]